MIIISSCHTLMTIFMHQQIRIYNIITINCTKSEIGYELAHLFKGCRDKCCDNSQYYHDPTSVMKATTEPSNGTIIATPTISDCNTIEDSISSTTPYPTHTQIKNLSTAAINSSTLIKTIANLPKYNVTSTAIATTEFSNGTNIATPTMSDHDTTEGSISSTTLYNDLITWQLVHKPHSYSPGQ